MLPTYLSPEKNAETNDGNAVRNFLESFTVKYVTGSLSELHLLAAGEVEFQGHFFPCTQSFLETAASAIKMPATYAYDIDPELFRHNFEERKAVKNQPIKVCLIDGRAVSLTYGAYRPARTIDIIEALPTVNKGFWNFQKLAISDRSVAIDMLSDDLTAEPIPGDEIRTGIRITNSETGGTGLKASLFTYRLVCKNGAVMRDFLGTVRWNYDKRVTYVSSIAKFIDGLQHLRMKQQKLGDVYADWVRRPVLEEEIVRLWRRIRSAANLSPQDADSILGITDEDRHYLTSAVIERRAAGLPARPSRWDTFTIHNRVTHAAKSFSLQIRSHFEQIGGDLPSLSSVN